jgi:hypothetical protein
MRWKLENAGRTGQGLKRVLGELTPLWIGA